MSKWLVIAFLALAQQMLFAQGAVETARAHPARYPAVWPKEMDRSSVPAWATSGEIRFARWDGGRIETAKAFLSGWPGLNPPDPNVVYTMTNWYDPDTIPLLKKAHINLIWVTFSNGFSIETEKAHQAEVRRYIAECHRNGIHVMAYESLGNIFWEDMFRVVPASKGWVQLKKDGQPTPYGAAEYAKVGRVTRYMANLSNPEWQAYIIRGLDLAIDSGADGIIYDNNFGNALIGLYQKIRAHAAARKHDFLIMANFHDDTYSLNRLLNCITTEDGREPGLWKASSPGYASIKAQWPYLRSIGDRYLVNNFGLLSIHETLSEGWKPTMIEDGTREGPTRLEALMSPGREKLALAENMAFSIPLEQFVEAYPANALYTGQPEATAVWQAVAQYNKFFAAHEDLYTGARSTAPLAIILDDRSEGVPILDALASQRVPFEIVYERDITPQVLSRYHAIALLTAQTMRNSSLSALEQFVKQGGQLLATRSAATLTEKGEPGHAPSFFSGRLGKGSAALVADNQPIDQLAKALVGISGEKRVRFNAPPQVLYHVTEKAVEKQTIIHLLNYGLETIPSITLEISGRYASARLLSPDGASSLNTRRSDLNHTVLQVDQLGIYSLIVLTNAGRQSATLRNRTNETY